MVVASLHTQTARRGRELEKCLDNLRMVLAMNNVGDHGQPGEVRNYFDSGIHEFLGSRAQFPEKTIGEWPKRLNWSARSLTTTSVPV